MMQDTERARALPLSLREALFGWFLTEEPALGVKLLDNIETAMGLASCEVLARHPEVLEEVRAAIAAAATAATLRGVQDLPAPKRELLLARSPALRALLDEWREARQAEEFAG